jgi:tRNA wybutosine-synthesizing protein 3
LAASLNEACSVLSAAFNAGFRESGAMSLPRVAAEESTLMVGIRSLGVSFDCIIGYQDDHGELHSLVDDKYVRNMFAIANERFKTNKERINRFQIEVERMLECNISVEDAETRRRRKREEGLARQKHLKEIATANKEQSELSHVQDLDLLG